MLVEKMNSVSNMPTSENYNERCKKQNDCKCKKCSLSSHCYALLPHKKTTSSVQVTPHTCTTCKHCSATFETEGDLLEHEVTECYVTSIGLESSEEKIKDRKCIDSLYSNSERCSKTRKRVRCQHCSETFKTVGMRNDHVRNKHAKLRPHSCAECGEAFYRKFNLMRHKKKHSSERMFKCSVCSARFKSHGGLKVHVAVIHSDQRPFMCEVCGKAFKTLGVLEAHSVIHSTLSKYSCDVCGKLYRHRASLFLHKRTHSGIRPYSCPECSASFTVKSHLTDHLRRHTGAKPFRCSLCPSTFSRSSTLKKHLHTHVSSLLVAGAQTNTLKPSHKITETQGKSIKSPTVTHVINDLGGEAGEGCTTLPGLSEDYITLCAESQKDENVVILYLSALRDGISCKFADINEPSTNRSADVANQSQKWTIINYSMLSGSKNKRKPQTQIKSELYNIEDHEDCESQNLICQKDSSSSGVYRLPDNKSSIKNVLTVDTKDLKSCSGVQDVHSESIISETVPEDCDLYHNSVLSESDDCVVIHVNGTAYDHETEKRTKVINSVELEQKEEMNIEQIEHERSLHPLPFSCDMCHLLFSSRNELKKHMQLHSNAHSYTCPTCHQSFLQVISLTTHQCDQSFHSRGVSLSGSQNQIHVASQKAEGCCTDSEFMCEVCGKAFKKKFVLKVHRRKHSGVMPYSCGQCGEKFISVTHRRVHERVHSGQRPFECDICNKFFRCRSHLSLHLQKCHLSFKNESVTYTNAFPITSLACMFPQKISSLKKESRAKKILLSVVPYNDLNNLNDNHKIVDSRVLSPHFSSNRSEADTVKFNEDSFQSSAAADSKVQSKHGRPITLKQKNRMTKASSKTKILENRPGGMLKCDHCPKVFKYLSLLQDHMRCHTSERPFSCPICGKSFNRKRNMMSHSRMHTQQKQHLCHVCGKYFAYKFSLEAHQRIHTQERPFACDICSKSFRYESSRAVHIKRHTEDKAFPCDLCTKAFVTRQDREVHRRTHTGEKPHVCGQCGRGFAAPHHLADHSRLHTGQRPFRCQVCGLAFSRARACQTHQRQHHLPLSQRSHPQPLSSAMS